MRTELTEKEKQRYLEIEIKHPQDEKPIGKEKKNTLNSFLFVTRDVHSFMESKNFALIKATLMELDRPSINGRIYRFAEGRQIAKSMIGRPVYYELDYRGRHVLKKPPIGEVYATKLIGNKVKGSLLQQP